MSAGGWILLAGLVVFAFGGYLHWVTERTGSYYDIRIHWPVYLTGWLMALFASFSLAFDGSNQPLPLIVIGGASVVTAAVYLDGLARDRW